ncbi:MAG: ATP-binding cassette domain-containing protein, partial [Myxococcales bacterium]|nr:ATP-binding cassette domain-containing protein [Myxococcales bacterium]
MSDALGSPYIETTGVRRIFADGDKRVEVLKGIDLRVRHGESLAILGPSGAGKSTFLHILGGLDAPSEGTIRYGGTEIFSLGEKARAEFRNREIGFVFQFHHLLPEF